MATPRKPFGSRLRKAFIAAVAVLGIGGGSVITLDNLPKNPQTDTQTVTSYNVGQYNQSGYNISPSDQLWKQTINMRSGYQNTVDAMNAAQTGDSWRVQALIDKGALKVNSQDGIDALATAAYNGHNDVVSVFLRNGADPTANDSQSLLSALQGGQFTIAERLMGYGAQASAQNNRGLMIAVDMNYAYMAQLLIDNGADATANDSAAFKAAKAMGYDGVADVLKAAGATDGTEVAPLPSFNFNYTLFGNTGSATGPYSIWNYGGPFGPTAPGGK
ncbi:MAG: ankyrin repeat domain-containing protein [Alphaproteobacteria bacterium]